MPSACCCGITSLGWEKEMVAAMAIEVDKEKTAVVRFAASSVMMTMMVGGGGDRQLQYKGRQH